MSKPRGLLKHSIVILLMIVSACTENPTHEACLESNEFSYVSSKLTEVGINAPNRAGHKAFNERAPVPGFENRKKSEFAFRYKGNGNSPLPNCTSKKLSCGSPDIKFCQSFQCEVTLPAFVEIHIIDTPKSEFYRTVEPTYMYWNGEELRCKPI